MAFPDDNIVCTKTAVAATTETQLLTANGLRKALWINNPSTGAAVNIRPGLASAVVVDGTTGLELPAGATLVLEFGNRPQNAWTVYSTTGTTLETWEFF